MLRPRFALAMLLFLGATVPALAGGDGSWVNNDDNPWHEFWNDWHRNDCWMQPFNYPDRSSVWNIFDAEVAKGWEMQDLLSEAHFEAGNSKLSPAGKLKMHWILTQNPSPFRTVFVARAWSDEVTTKRLAAAQLAAAQMASPGPMPTVLVSNSEPVSTSADYVAGVNTWYSGYMTSMPKPQPEAFQNADSSGGGSGSSP